MFGIYLTILLPSLAVVFFALKAMSGYGIEWNGQQMSQGVSNVLAIGSLIVVSAANYFVLYFLFGGH